jgi:polyhydroxyalkanoate synthesis regulator phasin
MPQPKSPRSSSTRTRKPTAATKRSSTTTRRAAAKPAAATKPETAAQDNLKSLRDTLRRGVVITQDHLKEALDEAVKAGQLSRKDATALTRKIVASGRKQADAFRKDLDEVVGRGRTQAAKSGDRVLREVDRARRRAGVGASFPISKYDDLNATQVQARLGDLSNPQLRKVRDYEKRHANRKSVLAAVERKLA